MNLLTPGRTRPKKALSTLNKGGKVECLNYESHHNAIYRSDVAQRSSMDSVLFSITSWTFITILAVLLALTAYAVNIASENIAAGKYHTVSLVARINWVAGWVVFCGMNGILVWFASTIVMYVSPPAAGSGIPDVKSYLNGIDVPGILSFRTLVAKVLGSVGSVAGGLAVGKEGPFVHTGACIAHLIGSFGNTVSKARETPRVKAFLSKHAWIDVYTRMLTRFHLDINMRDIVTCGAAGGVAAAFRAPVGGVLFVLEEGATFYTNPLLWRCFYTTAIVVIALKGMMKVCAEGKCGHFGLGNFIIFEIRSGQSDFEINELVPLVILGLLGGVLGSAFTAINGYLCLWRRDVLSKYGARARILEVLCVSLLTSTIAYWFSSVVSCRPCPLGNIKCPNSSGHSGNYVQFLCPDGEYSDLATLLVTSQENAIRNLFSSNTEHEFRISTLVVFLALYYSLAIVTYGIAVPSGLFVPSIMIGSAYGRIVGIAMSNLAGSGIDEGTYALLGAASFLGGTMRMTVSLCVILLELTNNLSLLPLMMLVLVIAKCTGDLTDVTGVYDLQIEIKQLPLLHAEPEGDPDMKIKYLASSPVESLARFVTVADVLDILRETPYNTFPVKENADFVGTVLRNHILYAISNGALLQEGPRSEVSLADATRNMSLNQMERNNLTVSRVLETLTREQKKMIIDLKLLANECPMIVDQETPMEKVYALFRELGPRNILVVPKIQEVVGILSRKDIILSDAEASSLVNEGTELDARLMETPTKPPRE